MWHFCFTHPCFPESHPGLLSIPLPLFCFLNQTLLTDYTEHGEVTLVYEEKETSKVICQLSKISRIDCQIFTRFLREAEFLENKRLFSSTFSSRLFSWYRLPVQIFYLQNVWNYLNYVALYSTSSGQSIRKSIYEMKLG